MTTTPISFASPASHGPNKGIIALIVAGSVLLLAAVALAFLVVGKNVTAGGPPNADNPVPVPVATQSPSPSPQPVEPDGGNGSTGSAGNGNGGGNTPVDASPRFTSFTFDPRVYCDPYGEQEKPSPSIAWSSVNAVAVYWTPSDREANASNGYQVWTSGNQNDLSASKGAGERFEFPCNHEQHFTTTITLVGANGETVSNRVTFVDMNWGAGGDDED